MTVLRIPFLIFMIHHQAIFTKGHYIGKLPPDVTWQKSHNSEDFETWYKEEMVHDDDTALWNEWVPEPPRNPDVPPPPFTTKPSEDLCSLLLHNLEILATDNSFNCQPMSSDVKGDIPEMCSQAAVEVVNTCKMQNQGSDCLRESLKVRSFLSNFRFELLYPVLYIIILAWLGLLQLFLFISSFNLEE